MKSIKPISIKPLILGESVNFLNQESMECLVTQNGLVELIGQLVYYKEEGKSLYPEIYIFDDLNLIKQVLPTSQFCYIGNGDKDKQTMLKALKKCAPLTEGGWSIYILRKNDQFEYGVFKAGNSILSISISEILIDNGSEELKAILIHQVSDRIIEVKGVKANTLVINFGSQDDSNKSPTESQNKFIETILSKVDDKFKEPTRNFLKKLFIEILQKGHGTLACVVDSKKKISIKLNDGIILQQRIDIPKNVKDLLDNNDLQANSNLEGQFSLILGMLQSDGITVFTNKGEVAAYNVFVKHSKKHLKTSTNGGARSRTYLTLCDMIGKNIDSAYIQSQDGKIEFKEHGK